MAVPAGVTGAGVLEGLIDETTGVLTGITIGAAFEVLGLIDDEGVGVTTGRALVFTVGFVVVRTGVTEGVFDGAGVEVTG